MRAVRVGVLVSLVMFGATRLGEAENFNPGVHLLEGHPPQYVAYPSDPCMVAGLGSTVGILDKVHSCQSGGD